MSWCQLGQPTAQHDATPLCPGVQGTGEVGHQSVCILRLQFVPLQGLSISNAIKRGWHLARTPEQQADQSVMTSQTRCFGSDVHYPVVTPVSGWASVDFVLMP
jgi:hypothetical protein